MDHAATTPVKPEVVDAMVPYFLDDFGNSSSVHQWGRKARIATDDARSKVAQALNCETNEVYFTGGATEASNWAIKGYAHQKQSKGKHIITSSVEHHATLHTCEALEKEGFEVTYLPVDEYGLVNVEDVRNAIRPDTILVTVIFANNEIGTISPIAEIGAVCREHKVAFHTDAVQAIGKVPVDVKAMNIDLLSLSAHKFYGPKGVGALYIRKGIRLANLVHGGAHERGRRPGTLNVPAIVGLGTAIELAVGTMDEESKRLTILRDALIEGIHQRIPEVKLNGHPTKRLPNNANISFRYIEGEALLLSLDLDGIGASSGSACTSNSLDPSHVLLAMGIPHEIAHGSLRLTLGTMNDMDDVNYTIERLVIIVDRLRQMSPLYNG